MNFLTNQLIFIHAGGALAKIKSLFILTIFASPCTYIVESLTNWTVENATYVTFVFFAIIIDHLLGSFIHAFKLRDFSIVKNIVGLLIKVGLVVAVGFCFEGIQHIIQGDNVVKDYIIIVLRLLVFLYPAGSALANSSIATNGKFPPKGFLIKLDKFKESLNVGDIKS